MRLVIDHRPSVLIDPQGGALGGLGTPRAPRARRKRLFSAKNTFVVIKKYVFVLKNTVVLLSNAFKGVLGRLGSAQSTSGEPWVALGGRGHFGSASETPRERVGGPSVIAAGRLVNRRPRSSLS